MKEQKSFGALLSSVRPTDETAMQKAAARLDGLAKPPGSLGRLEEAAVALAGVYGEVHHPIKKKRLLVFAADNGVTEEGISSAPPSVTLAQTVNLTRQKTGAAVLCAHFGDEIRVFDVGIALPLPPEARAVTDCKISFGTANIRKKDAMPRKDAERAILIGAQASAVAAAEGVDVLGIGEMGIGNTTTSAAVLCALTGLAPEEATGRGGGLSDGAFARKKEVIADALRRAKPDPADPVGVLSAVGGLDIAAMTGAFLGAAACRIPAVADGFISAVAALCAVRLCPAARGYIFPSHQSTEPGYARAAAALGLAPFLSLGMRLGEGSGCPLAFEVLAAAEAVIGGMSTFAEAKIDDGYLSELRKNEGYFS